MAAIILKRLQVCSDFVILPTSIYSEYRLNESALARIYIFLYEFWKTKC